MTPDERRALEAARTYVLRAMKYYVWEASETLALIEKALAADAQGHGREPARELPLIAWAARLVRAVVGDEDDLAEPVRKVALEMRDFHDAEQPERRGPAGAGCVHGPTGSCDRCRPTDQVLFETGYRQGWADREADILERAEAIGTPVAPVKALVTSEPAGAGGCICGATRRADCPVCGKQPLDRLSRERTILRLAAGALLQAADNMEHGCGWPRHAPAVREARRAWAEAEALLDGELERAAPRRPASGERVMGNSIVYLGCGCAQLVPTPVNSGMKCLAHGMGVADVEDDPVMVAKILEQARPACTGVSAGWCPRCGDCSCPRDKDGGRVADEDTGHVDESGCPLHDRSSPHAEGPEPESPERVALRRLTEPARELAGRYAFSRTETGAEFLRRLAEAEALLGGEE